MHKLDIYGWNDQIQSAIQTSQIENLQPARVIAEFGPQYKVVTPDEITAEPAGRLLHTLAPTELPKVGDWVLIQTNDTGPAIIQEVLPRQSEISRLRSDRTRARARPERQILAVNVDLALLVQALDHDFSPQRFERYLFQLSSHHIRPIIVLNKIDQADKATVEAALGQLKELNAPVLAISAQTGEGFEAIKNIIKPGETAVLLGSSGVGKSTITNSLLGETRQATQAVRASDSKGRHTTSHRELFILPQGGLLIDTPGLRELQLWGAEEELNDTFPDVQELAVNCQFSDCSHTQEPRCAVRQAVTDGRLPAERLESYQQFQSELKRLAAQALTDLQLKRKHEQKQAQKQLNQTIRPPLDPM